MAEGQASADGTLLPPLIPAPREVRLRPGRFSPPPGGMPIRLAGGEESGGDAASLEETGLYLAGLLARAGLACTVVSL